jgi:putative Mn2+ efflux pump MntP
MKLFKTIEWSPANLGCFKWANILFGMIIGAYLSGFVKEYVWIFITLVVILSIKVMIFYFSDKCDAEKPK